MSNAILGIHVKLAPDLKLGNNVVIGDHVAVGGGSVIGNNVVIHANTEIGSNVRIDDNTVVGKLPMKAANSATTSTEELPGARIGDDCIVGTSVVVYRGCTIGNRVLIADLSTVRERVTVGNGTIIGRGVAIENYCTVGEFCKLETNVYLTAYSTVEDRCFIAPCVATSNDNFVGRTKERFKHFKGVTVRKGGRIGANATILPGKEIGEDSLVAAGAVVTKNIFAKKVYAGVPAREMRDVPEAQLLENQDFSPPPAKPK
jgi:UDP-2-acetamido-3-amino-2,3-dideoxy-glucuronate N-acetyltransferase